MKFPTSVLIHHETGIQIDGEALPLPVRDVRVMDLAPRPLRIIMVELQFFERFDLHTNGLVIVDGWEVPWYLQDHDISLRQETAEIRTWDDKLVRTDALESFVTLPIMQLTDDGSIFEDHR